MDVRTLLFVGPGGMLLIDVVWLVVLVVIDTSLNMLMTAKNGRAATVVANA